MIYSLGQTQSIALIILLLVLCLVTVEFCRRDRVRSRQSKTAFLFQGKAQIHSLASNIGALFSLTYFFGGAFIYGFFFGRWYLLASLAIMLTLLYIIPRMLTQIAKTQDGATATGNTSNILLDYLRMQLSRENFHVMLRLYSGVYFLLLVEELAVSRLVLGVMLPSHPVFIAASLSIICLTVFVYLSLGGFRAVLNSDLVQMTLVGAFVLCLTFLLLKNNKSLAAPSTVTPPTEAGYLTLGFIVVFGVAWFTAGVDFFSRLNFIPSRRYSILKQHQIFVVISLLLTFAVLAVGILYGIGLRSELAQVESTEFYTSQTIAHFFSLRRPLVTICFLASVFCMIFTTVDTLLLTLLQLGHYSQNRFLQRKQMPQVLFAAVTFSCFINFETVSFFGLFCGSLIILPAAGVFRVFSRRLRYLVPGRLRALEGAALMSTVLYLLVLDELNLIFEYHFLLPGFVLLSVIVSALLDHVIKKDRKNEDS